MNYFKGDLIKPATHLAIIHAGRRDRRRYRREKMKVHPPGLISAIKLISKFFIYFLNLTAVPNISVPR